MHHVSLLLHRIQHLSEHPGTCQVNESNRSYRKQTAVIVSECCQVNELSGCLSLHFESLNKEQRNLALLKLFCLGSDGLLSSLNMESNKEDVSGCDDVLICIDKEAKVLEDSNCPSLVGSSVKLELSSKLVSEHLTHHTF